MPHVRLSVRGPKKMGGAQRQLLFVVDQGSRVGRGKHSKQVILGPRTLRRTWGTRPVPLGDCCDRGDQLTALAYLEKFCT